MSEQSTRQIYAVEPGSRVFVHLTGIFPTLAQEEAQEGIATIARCESRYPQSRCSCGMFDVQWNLTDLQLALLEERER